MVSAILLITITMSATPGYPATSRMLHAKTANMRVCKKEAARINSVVLIPGVRLDARCVPDL